MWNAVEAHNMYRMLIKVFKNTGDRFIYKAAAVAWSKCNFELFPLTVDVYSQDLVFDSHLVKSPLKIAIK